MKLLIISAVFFILLDLVTGQSAWAAWTGQGPVTSDRQYWMDSATQCSLNNVFDVGTSTSTIYGKAAVQINPGSLTECSITLRTGIPREKRRFSVEIVLGNVNELGVQFTMYDGSDINSNRLFTISLGQSADRTKKYVTSGGFVTFYLKKDSPGNADFSIQMIARVIPGDITNQDECKTGNEYGCSDYGYTTPIDKETIIGIVGGIFGLIVFIIIPIIIVCCYRKSKGVNKKWDEFNLRETLNTAADIHSSSASLSKSKRDLWTSQSSRTPYSDYKKSRSRYSDGDGSVFSDGTDIPPKSRPPPPPYDEYDRGHSYRDGPRGYRNGRDDRFNRNDRYDNRSDRDYRSDRNYRHRYDSEKREPSQKSYFSSSDDTSFVQGRDDHPQEVFIERVIEPRVKPASKAEKQKRAKFEEDDEDPYDKIVEDSPRMKSKKEVKESAMQCEEESSEDNESNTESGEDQPSTDDTDDDIIKKKELEAKKSALYAKPNKSRKKQTEQQPPAAISQPSQAVYPVPPGGVHMVPGQPVFFSGQPPPNGPQMFPRPVHPTQPYFNQQPHVRPIMSMSAIPPHQPMVQGYPRPPMSARLPPPVQAQRPPPPMYSTSQPPQQPPVFTHLVQRGYGRQSPSLDGSEGRIQTDDSDMTANLASGVEFMKRTTTTV